MLLKQVFYSVLVIQPINNLISNVLLHTLVRTEITCLCQNRNYMSSMDNAAVSPLLHYLDDFLTIGPPDSNTC